MEMVMQFEMIDARFTNQTFPAAPSAGAIGDLLGEPFLTAQHYTLPLNYTYSLKCIQLLLSLIFLLFQHVLAVVWFFLSFCTLPFYCICAPVCKTPPLLAKKSISQTERHLLRPVTSKWRL